MQRFAATSIKYFVKFESVT